MPPRTGAAYARRRRARSYAIATQVLRYAMVRRRLPIGLQTFRELREQDCYYVDKTAYIERLLHEGKHYFLSRRGGSARVCSWTR